MPQRIDISYQVSCVVVLHHDFSQATPFKQVMELISVGKSENRIACWYVRWRGDSDLYNCFPKEALYPLFARIVPPRQGYSAGWPKSSDTFSDRCLRVRKVS